MTRPLNGLKNDLKMTKKEFKIRKQYCKARRVFVKKADSGVSKATPIYLLPAFLGLVTLSLLRKVLQIQCYQSG